MLSLRPKGRALMLTAVPCKEEAELMTRLARLVGRFPINRGTIAGSKYIPLVRLASVQSPRGPGFSGANSVGVESRTRFFRGPPGNREAYMAHNVPPWDCPKRLISLAPEVSRIFWTAPCI